MRDNFEKISNLLDWSEPGTFYFVQILKRRKENSEMKSGTSVIDNLYIYEKEDLEKLKSKIIERCEKHNARAYINLNKLDLENIALYTSREILNCIIKKDFKSVKNVYASVCGSYHSDDNKKWIIDIDKETIPYIEEVREIVKKLHLEITNRSYRILDEIPTKNGIHIISNPFNMEKFNKEVNHIPYKIEVQKNSPTLLFIGD